MFYNHLQPDFFNPPMNLSNSHLCHIVLSISPSHGHIDSSGLFFPLDNTFSCIPHPSHIQSRHPFCIRSNIFPRQISLSFYNCIEQNARLGIHYQHSCFSKVTLNSSSFLFLPFSSISPLELY